MEESKLQELRKMRRQASVNWEFVAARMNCNVKTLRFKISGKGTNILTDTEYEHVKSILNEIIESTRDVTNWDIKKRR